MKFPLQIKAPNRFLRAVDRFLNRGRFSLNTFGEQTPVPASPNSFGPAESNAAQLGFLEGDHRSRFDEACSTLNVRQVSQPKTSYGTRSVGAKVIDQTAAACWLKVFGLTSQQNERWQTEMEADAITGVAKPSLIRQFTWTHDNEFWVARLTTFVPGIVEAGPWAETGAHRVKQTWLDSLYRSLEALAHQPCARVHIQTSLFERWLARHFRRRPLITASDWVPSHNDLQWSNLSHPDLSILDWEWFGRSPRGYDVGMLIAYSAHNDELTSRLEKTFEPALANDIEMFGRLFAAHTVRNAIRDGWLPPAMTVPVERLIDRWESQSR